jgi:uncharacterized protein YcfJ
MMKMLGRGYVTGFLLALIAMLALIVGGCSTSSHGPDDQQVVASINNKIGQDPDLRTLSVKVTSKQGVVTLSGMVNAPVEKLAVEDVARNMPGVKQVDDDLTIASVSGETGVPPPSSEQAAASAPPYRHARRSAKSIAQNQPPPNDEQAQNASQLGPDNPAQAQNTDQGAADNSSQAQDNSQPAPDNSSQDQNSSQPAGSNPSATPPASAPGAPAPAPAVPPSQQVTIAAGTVVHVRMIDGISSGTAEAGQVYKASFSAPISIGDQVVIPRGATARVRVVDAQSTGHYQGQPLLKLELVGLTVNGAKYSTRSDYYTKVGPSRSKNTAEKVGGGAAIGALLGGLLGRGKGAGIGAVVGAGAGTVDQRATQAQEVRIPSEARIDFTLKRPLSITIGGGS